MTKVVSEACPVMTLMVMIKLMRLCGAVGAVNTVTALTIETKTRAKFLLKLP